MAKSITVNTGERIEVKNTDGEIMGYFYFNPADPDIMRRCEEAQRNMGELSDSIKDNPTAEELTKVNSGLREQIAYILGNGAAETLFRYNSPLALMPDGTIYGVYVFDIICDFIKAEVEERMEKSKQQADKYTAKYQS